MSLSEPMRALQNPWVSPWPFERFRPAEGLPAVREAVKALLPGLLTESGTVFPENGLDLSSLVTSELRMAWS